MQPVNHPAINSCCATDASRSVLKGFESSIMNIDASERLSPKMKKVRDDPSCAVTWKCLQEKTYCTYYRANITSTKVAPRAG